jgi:hypothetical protein
MTDFVFRLQDILIGLWMMRRIGALQLGAIKCAFVSGPNTVSEHQTKQNDLLHMCYLGEAGMLFIRCCHR